MPRPVGDCPIWSGKGRIGVGWGGGVLVGWEWGECGAGGRGGGLRINRPCRFLTCADYYLLHIKDKIVDHPKSTTINVVAMLHEMDVGGSWIYGNPLMLTFQSWILFCICLSRDMSRDMPHEIVKTPSLESRRKQRSINT